MRSSQPIRLLLSAAVFALVALAASIDAPGLRAQCCGFGISNNTDCRFRITMTTVAGDSVLLVPVGGDSYTIPDCGRFRLRVTDACGVDHYFPVVIGECINVFLGTGCCIRICKISECRWDVTLTHCLCP